MFKKIEFKKECIHCVPDENLVGKRVLFGDNWTDIKSQVESNNWTSCRRTLSSINYDSNCPFVIKNDNKILEQYKFVYYDSEWNRNDEETVYYCYLDRDIEPIQFMISNEKPSSHIYAEFTDRDLACKWCYMHDRIAYIARAWEEGKTIQRRNAYGNWEDCEPEWDLYVDYRVKPEDKLEPIEIEKDTYVANGAEISKKRRMTNKELAYWLAQSKGQKATINGNAVCCHNYDLDDDDKEVGDCMIRGWDEKEWHEPEVEVTI